MKCYNIIHYQITILVGVAIACSFLGSTYLDMGDIKQARELLTKSVNISTFIYGSHHMQTALAQTRLGNILR